MEIQAVVRRKNKNREGKGFSQAELKEAGICYKRALRTGIPIDLRRRTKHEENIELLRRYSEDLTTKTQPRDEDQQVEEKTG